MRARPAAHAREIVEDEPEDPHRPEVGPLERLRVLQVPGVVHLVSFNGLPASVPEEEMEALRAAVRLRRAQPHPYYSLGDRVRILAGPLKGLQGTLIMQQSSSRMIVAVDFIHRSVSVELEPNDLGGVL